MDSIPFDESDLAAAFPDFNITFPRIGRSGQKAVYRAEKSQNDLALKVLPVSPESDESDSDESLAALERFQREVQAMDVLHCPHLVRLAEGPGTRTIGPRPYYWFAEPFLIGGTLQDRLRSGPLPADDLHGLTRSLLIAVDAMSNQGLVHRDINPGNIGYDAAGTVVLFDLGIALVTDQSAITATSLPGPGSQWNAAPEQFLARRDAVIDFRTDQFLVGMVVVEALTGHHPFGKSNLHYIQRLSAFDASILDAHDLHPGLRKVIPRLLAPHPSGRFRKTEMALALLGDL